ncbi:hypothetical protein ACVWYS_004126 [Arthrobacter sp. TE12231]
MKAGDYNYSKPAGIPWVVLNFLVNLARLGVMIWAVLHSAPLAALFDPAGHISRLVALTTWLVLHGPPPGALLHFAVHLVRLAVMTMVIMQGASL